MTMTVKIFPRPKVLLVVSAGEFSLDESTRTFVDIISAIEKYRSEKVLFDGREIVGDPTIVERFYYGEFAAANVAQLIMLDRVDAQPQFAYVLHEPVLDPRRFGEIVAVNRGMNVKAFDDMDKAVKWLDLSVEDIQIP